MRPTLWTAPFSVPGIGEVTFPAYSTLVGAGILLGFWLAWKTATRAGISRDDVIDLSLWCVLWGFAGARVMHVLADGHLHEYVHLCTDPTRIEAEKPTRPDPDSRWMPGPGWPACAAHADCGTDSRCESWGAPGAALRMLGVCDGYFLCGEDRRCHPPRDCLIAAKAWRGGLAFYGGLVAATLFSLWWTRRWGLSFWRVADHLAPPIAIGMTLGRLGCWLNGCCFGKVCPIEDGGVVFPIGTATWQRHVDLALIERADPPLPVYPTQLWQAALDFALFLVLYFAVRPRKRAHGEVLAWMLILGALTRAFVEHFRDDDRGVYLGGLISSSQILAVALVAAGVWILVKRPGGSAPQASSPGPGAGASPA